MPDLIPENCISVRAAYDLFASGLWSGNDPVDELNSRKIYRDAHPAVVQASKASLSIVTDQMLVAFVEAFASGALEALVRPPDKTENYAIPADSWRAAFFAERAFLSTEIAGSHGGYWDAIIGRTPFVKRANFDQWLEAQIRRKRDPRAMPLPATRALNDHLITIVKDGLLGSTEVEELARTWGLPPLASRPAPEEHDPLKLSRWTLCMAVSWIVFREIGDVREAMDEYRSNSWEWTSLGRRLPVEGGTEWYEVWGEELSTRNPLSITMLELMHIGEDQPSTEGMHTTISNARLELWRLLGEEMLVASGLDATGQISIIPAHEWSYLRLACGRDGTDYIHFAHNPFGQTYRNVTVPRSAVLAHWPAVSSPQIIVPPERTITPTLQGKGGKLEATRQALATLFPEGVPLGLKAKERLARVNDWHRQRGNSQVSLTTVLRALAAG